MASTEARKRFTYKPATRDKPLAAIRISNSAPNDAQYAAHAFAESIDDVTFLLFLGNPRIQQCRWYRSHRSLMAGEFLPRICYTDLPNLEYLKAVRTATLISINISTQIAFSLRCDISWVQCRENGLCARLMTADEPIEQRNSNFVQVSEARLRASGRFAGKLEPAT